MTPEMRRLIALVDLNGKTKQLHDDFAGKEGDADIAAVLKQIGEQITICVGLMVRRRAEREQALVGG